MSSSTRNNRLEADGFGEVMHDVMGEENEDDWEDMDAYYSNLLRKYDMSLRNVQPTCKPNNHAAVQTLPDTSGVPHGWLVKAKLKADILFTELNNLINTVCHSATGCCGDWAEDQRTKDFKKNSSPEQCTPDSCRRLSNFKLELSSLLSMASSLKNSIPYLDTDENPSIKDLPWSKIDIEQYDKSVQIGSGSMSRVSTGVQTTFQVSTISQTAGDKTCYKKRHALSKLLEFSNPNHYSLKTDKNARIGGSTSKVGTEIESLHPKLGIRSTNIEARREGGRVRFPTEAQSKCGEYKLESNEIPKNRSGKMDANLLNIPVGKLQCKTQRKLGEDYHKIKKPEHILKKAQSTSLYRTTQSKEHRAEPGHVTGDVAGCSNFNAGSSTHTGVNKENELDKPPHLRKNAVSSTSSLIKKKAASARDPSRPAVTKSNSKVSKTSSKQSWKP